MEITTTPIIRLGVICKLFNNQPKKTDHNYPLDRSVNEEGVEEYLLSLKAVGLIELTSVIPDNTDKLKLRYKITDYGASRMKYIS